MIIRHLLAASALAALPLAAVAEPNVSFSSAVNTDFATGSGLDHAATTFEGEVSYENSGYHGSFWLGSLYKDPTDDFEYELALGYGREIDRFRYDASLTGYFLNSSGYQSTGLGLELAYAVDDATEAGYYGEVNLDDETTLHELSLSHDIGPNWSVWAMLGTDEAGADNYGEVGASFAVNDMIGAEFIYADDSDADGTLSVSLTFASPLSGN